MLVIRNGNMVRGRRKAVGQAFGFMAICLNVQLKADMSTHAQLYINNDASIGYRESPDSWLKTTVFSKVRRW